MNSDCGDGFFAPDVTRNSVGKWKGRKGKGRKGRKIYISSAHIQFRDYAHGATIGCPNQELKERLGMWRKIQIKTHFALCRIKLRDKNYRPRVKILIRNASISLEKTSKFGSGTWIVWVP